MEKFARQCDVTGEGMNEGWCFGDGQNYAKYQEGADKLSKDYGYDTFEEAYDDDVVYWTSWEDEDDYQYQMIDGKLVEIN